MDDPNHFYTTGLSAAASSPINDEQPDLSTTTTAFASRRTKIVLVGIEGLWQDYIPELFALNT